MRRVLPNSIRTYEGVNTVNTSESLATFVNQLHTV